MKKKVFGIVFLLTICMCALGVAAGCKVHMHTYNAWTTVTQATCTENGLKTHSCTVCGYVTERIIPATGHTNGEWQEGTAANCTQSGTVGHYECTVCHTNFDYDNNVITDLNVAGGSHAFGEWTEEVSATCLAEGVRGHYECTACNKYFDKSYVEITDLRIAKQHNLKLEKGVAPTCTENGKKDAYRCMTCRDLFDENANKITDRTIGALGHDYTDWIEKAATETENGIIRHRDCKRCEFHFDEKNVRIINLVIPATGHSFGDWTEEIAPTCTENGTKGHYECGDCNKYFDKDYEVIADITIPAAHKLIHRNKLEPTCISEGYEEYWTCEVCEDIFDKDGNPAEITELGKISHTFGAWTETIPATCYKDGLLAHKKCTACKRNFDKNDVEISVIIKRAHNLTHYPEISATCTTEGRQAYDHCETCNADLDVFERIITDLGTLKLEKIGHRPGDLIAAIEPTCTKSGNCAHYICSGCNGYFDTSYNPIKTPALKPTGHIYTTTELIPQKDETCDEDGYYAHFECKFCHNAFNDQGVQMVGVASNGNEYDYLTIQKHGHDGGSRIKEKAPTCTTPGLKAHNICSVCGKKYRNPANSISLTDEDLIIPATGHTYTHLSKAEATCSAEGRVECYICELCDAYFDSDKKQTEKSDLTIAKKDHEYGALIGGTAATETTDGSVDHYECANCKGLFDADKNAVESVLVPKTAHVFGSWTEEKPATCYNKGVKGYYHCSHCDKKFDKNYNEITDIALPVSHSFGKLVTPREGVCDEPDILLAHYKCLNCNHYFDEDGTEVYYSDIFENKYRHDYTSIDYDYQYHITTCNRCDNLFYFEHEYEYSYPMTGTMHCKLGTCVACGRNEKFGYFYPVASIGVAGKIYVEDDMLPAVFFINYKNNSYGYVSADSVMDSDELQKYYAAANRLKDSEELTEITEKFSLTYYNFTTEAEITFTHYKIYKIMTERPAYMQGTLSGVNELSNQLVCDSNITRENPQYENIYGSNRVFKGEITDAGDFDADYDFTGHGVDSVEFTFSYKYRDVTYTVTFVYYADGIRKLDYFGTYTTDITAGKEAQIYLYYSDNTSEYHVITQDDVAEGTFDPETPGTQTFTICINGLFKTLTITVHDPEEVASIYAYEQTINVGETAKVIMYKYNNENIVVDLTPDIYIGVFDNMTPGQYDIDVFYDKIMQHVTYYVFDPDDYSIDHLTPALTDYYEYYTWLIVDGEIVVDVSHWYIYAVRKNRTSTLIKVTEDMIWYNTAEEIKSGKSFYVTVSYKGCTTSFKVTAKNAEKSEVRNLTLYAVDKIQYGSQWEIFAKIQKDGDGNEYIDLSNYFINVQTDDGHYYVPLTEDLIYSYDESGELTPFDFKNAGRPARHDVRLKYHGVYSDENTFLSLLLYSESEESFNFWFSNPNVEIPIGTKAEIEARLKQETYSLGCSIHYVDNNGINTSYWFESKKISGEDIMFYFDDPSLDLTKPGSVYIKASYKGHRSDLSIMLAPDTCGVPMKKFDYINEHSSQWEIRIYDNGYIYSGLRKDWGTWKLIDEGLKLYSATFDDTDIEYFTIDEKGNFIYYRGSMISDDYEEFTIRSPYGEILIKVYTKNGISLADIYEDGEFDHTEIAKFLDNGKLINVYEGNVYTIKENNVLEIEPEGKTIYYYINYESEDRDEYVKGLFNDNGMIYVYLYIGDSEYGNDEFLMFAYKWKEIDGIAYIYVDGNVVASGIILNDYVFIEDD